MLAKDDWNRWKNYRYPTALKVVVTIVTNGEFWLDASEPSLEAIWGNPEDDVYGSAAA